MCLSYVLICSKYDYFRINIKNQAKNPRELVIMDTFLHFFYFFFSLYINQVEYLYQLLQICKEIITQLFINLSIGLILQFMVIQALNFIYNVQELCVQENRQLMIDPALPLVHIFSLNYINLMFSTTLSSSIFMEKGGKLYYKVK